MSIPIRIMNDGVKEIRVTQVGANDLPVNSYRIPAGQMSPTFDAEGVTLFSWHAFVVTDEPEHVARNPMQARDTDVSQLRIQTDLADEPVAVVADPGVSATQELLVLEPAEDDEQEETKV